MLGTDLKIQATGILQELMEYSPIIFEECFVIDKDPKFVQMTKQCAELTEDKIRLACDPSHPKKSSQIGVHLFVMCHGF